VNAAASRGPGRPGQDHRDVVAAKRDGLEVAPTDLRGFVLAYARGEVPDYLAAAFLMAAFVNGLSPEETAWMTRAMVDSGDTLALSSVTRPKVDKHSTGGVSDGVTLVFAPLAASLGLAVAKLSGRGLGHTGGTLDKLESIPGLRTDLTPEELERQVGEVGCAVAGQSPSLVPADGALYALRDATATVPSIPLIAASVMSKKLAVGSDLVMLDVKAGSGAFMKTPGAAAELASACMALASRWGRAARAAVTDMSQPLGRAVGNALEVAETVRVLQGQERGRLVELSLAFAGEALSALRPAGKGRGTAGRGRGSAREDVAPGSGTDALALVREAERALASGAAIESFRRMVQAQGGDPRVVDDPGAVLPQAPLRVEVEVPAPGGWLAATDGEELGRAAVALGAGRRRKGDAIDPAVGFVFHPAVGERLEPGAPLATVHARDRERAEVTERAILGAITLSPEPVPAPPLIHGWYGGDSSGLDAAGGGAGAGGAGGVGLGVEERR
jgi:pyrimidine-nucleoside phosphorylase